MPEPGRVTLDESGFAQATLRSRWLGTATVTAERPGFLASEIPVVFVFPLRFLGAALLGGLIGGLLRFWTNFKLGKKKPSIGPFIWGGLLAGLIVAVAAALGINLAGAPFVASLGRFNEAVVFVFGAIGGYYGLKKAKAGVASDVLGVDEPQ